MQLEPLTATPLEVQGRVSYKEDQTITACCVIMHAVLRIV